MITKFAAINNLSQHIGADLFIEAEKYGVTVFKNNKQNKGWKGITLEYLAGLTFNNKQAPNGLGFELKSTAFYEMNGHWVPKETFAITMINATQLIESSFFESHCWEKLKSLIYCAVSWQGRNNPNSRLLKVMSFDLLENDLLIHEIEADYELIRTKLINHGFGALTGKDGKWIQARTKGPGHGSTSRAFYAKKCLISEILKLE